MNVLTEAVSTYPVLVVQRDSKLSKIAHLPARNVSNNLMVEHPVSPLIVRRSIVPFAAAAVNQKLLQACAVSPDRPAVDCIDCDARCGVSCFLQEQHFETVRREGFFQEGDQRWRDSVCMHLLEVETIFESNLAGRFRTFGMSGHVWARWREVAAKYLPEELVILAIQQRQIGEY